MKYSSKYYEIDCHVLLWNSQGVDAWIYWFRCRNYITIQSLCSDYKLNEGCYDDVAMLSGVVQHYISTCIVGGRCMTSNNKVYHVKSTVADFDACSLYPSAMNMMKGHSKGTPKVLNASQLNYNL